MVRRLALMVLIVSAHSADFEYLYRAALEQREQTLGKAAPKTQESARDLALYLAGRGEYDKAAPYAAQAIEFAATAADAAALHNWAGACEDRQPEQAERFYRRALKIRERLLAPLDPDLGTTRLNLAALLLERPGAREAAPLARAALDAFDRKLGPLDARTGAAAGVLATALAIQGDVAGAERLFRRALAVAEKVHGPDSPLTASALENLADLLGQTGRELSARPLLDRAQRIRARTC